MSLSPAEQAAILTQVSEANLPCAELVVKLVDQAEKDRQTVFAYVGVLADLQETCGGLEGATMPEAMRFGIEYLKGKLSAQQKHVEDAEIAAIRERHSARGAMPCSRCKNTGKVQFKSRLTFETDSADERAAAWTESICPQCKGAAIHALVDVHTLLGALSDSKREIGELKYELGGVATLYHAEVDTTATLEAQVLALTNELEGERKRLEDATRVLKRQPCMCERAYKHCGRQWSVRHAETVSKCDSCGQWAKAHIVNDCERCIFLKIDIVAGEAPADWLEEK